MSTIDSLPPLRQVISKNGISARKSLGQNFLMDLNLTWRIACAAGNLKNCDVVEIGSGPGGLTRGILASGARRVLAVEKDSRCIPALLEISEHYPGNLEVIHADALEVDLASIATPPVKIIANLPYNVGTHMLVRWLSAESWPPFWESMTLMFQKEVADRIVANPGVKAYGRLGVLTQWRSDARMIMKIPSDAFTPPPKVASAVVQITSLPVAKYPSNPKVLKMVVAKAFNQRRKMLRSALKGIAPDIENQLRICGINPEVRAENTTIEQFCSFARQIEADILRQIE